MFRSIASLLLLAASAAAQTTSTSTQVTASPTSGAYGTSINLSASTTSGTAKQFPSGTITFKDGTTALGTAPVTSDAFTRPTFSTLTLTNPPSSAVGLVLTGDVNGDGKPDLVVNVQTGLQTFINNGNGTYTGAAVLPFSASFSITGNQFALTDYNGDGKMDLLDIVSGGLQVLLGDGTGVFAAPAAATAISITGITSSGVRAMATVDLTGSGHLDVVVGYTGPCPGGEPACEFAPYVATFLNHGDGTFSSANVVALPMRASDNTDYAQAFQFTDLNGDDKKDILASIHTTSAGETKQSETDVLINNGDGTLRAGMEDIFAVFSGSGFYAVSASPAIGDFNGDGKVDVVQIESPFFGSYQYSLVKGNGDGTFATPAVFGSGPAVTFSTFQPVATSSITAVDLNGDGNLDLVNGQGYALHGNGDGTFAAPVLTTPLSVLGVPVAADWNGDGVADVLLTVSPTSTPPYLGFVQGNAAGSAALAALTTLAPGTHSITSSYGGNATLAASTSAPATVTISKQTPVITATSSTAGVAVISPVTLSVKVTGTLQPTGQVTFVQGATTLGTANLDASGNATTSYTFSTVGTQTVTANYSGDANTASGSVTVSANTLPVIAEQPPAGSTTLSAHAGGTATASIAVASQNGFSGTVTLSCSGLPSGASCSFNPASFNVTPTTTGSSTLTISVSQTTSRNSLPWQTGGVLTAGLLFGIGMVSRRRRIGGALLAIAVILALGGLAGCSSSSAPVAKSYNFNVVATSGTAQTMTPYTLNVQ